MSFLYLRLLQIQLKASALLMLQYRVDFFVQVFMALFWGGIALVPLLVLFTMREGVAGFTAYEAYIVVGFFVALKGVIEGVIQPSLLNVVEHIRKGTLDFLLLKPVDAQFMLSTSKFQLARVVDVIAGFGLVSFALYKARGAPAWHELLTCFFVFLCALIILYSLWIMVVSLSFHVVKVDNLSYLIVSVFDAARFPASIFRGGFALVFTFIIPLALMTTYPALALLGRIQGAEVATSMGVALAFLGLSRLMWLRSIRAYTGAGG